MKKGKVKFFNETKGFGFVCDAETGEEIFVHASGLKQAVYEGDDITYEVTQGKRGLNAINVTVSA